MSVSTLTHPAAARPATLTRALRQLRRFIAAQPTATTGGDDVRERCRVARWQLLRQYAGEIYDSLTDRRRRYLRLDELVATAARSFPDLCPDAGSSAWLGDPSGAGWDAVDLGLFCAAMFAEPGPGQHLITAMRQPTVEAVARFDEYRSAGRLDLGAVVLERSGRAAHLTLTNGDSLNAEDNALVAALETAVDLVLLDDQVCVGVVRGGPMKHPKYAGRRVFCAGINLTELYHGRISYLDFLLRRELGPLHKIWRGLAHPTRDDGPGVGGKPWVGAVEGFAIGGGVQLLLVTDRIVAAQDAYFSVPAAQEGIVPGLANLRLSRWVGARRARQMILTGRRITAGEPAGRDLCDDVVPADQVDATINRAVTELDTAATVANRFMLNEAEEPVEKFRRYLADFAVVQARRLCSQDLADNLEQAWARRTR